jgi:hypothetical protein
MPLRLAYLGITNGSRSCGCCQAATGDTDAEILASRHQRAVLQRQLGGQRIWFETADRAWLAALLHRPRQGIANAQPLVSLPEPIADPDRHHPPT